MTALRPPDTVMRLERMGAAQQTRLSFMRVLLRQMRREGWRVDRPVWKIGADGTGHAVYRATGPRRVYSLVAFAHDLPDDQRTDRVIAEAWDATFALVDGEASEDDIERLSRNVPKQEAGRISDRELVLSRANRSTRLWDHVVARLAAGQQPDPAKIGEVGYLMRTTAVYGSGKFGAADFAARRDRPLMGGPFRAEMLTVWLIRAFVVDLAEHMARSRGGARAVPLAPELRRRFGIGNSTGLGMAPFLVNHPALLDAWIGARETALARVRAQPSAPGASQRAFAAVVLRAQHLLRDCPDTHPEAARRLRALSADAERLAAHLDTGPLSATMPWERLWQWAEQHLSIDGQEWLAALMLEPHGDLIDGLADKMAVDESQHFRIDGHWPLARVRDALRRHFGWALGCDYGADAACARFWYVSEAKEEPRLGQRHDEPGAALEHPLDVARQAAALDTALEGWDMATPTADFLAQAPAHRRILRRLQLSETAPYAEIRDNLIAADMLPIDMLRCKLAFFGATRFDPRSDRWVRITMFQNAPYPHELAAAPEDDWAYPPLPSPEPAE